MVMLVDINIVQLFDTWPISYVILKHLSIVYWLYLAFKIPTAKTASTKELKIRPLTFAQASLFQ